MEQKDKMQKARETKQRKKEMKEQELSKDCLEELSKDCLESLYPPINYFKIPVEEANIILYDRLLCKAISYKFKANDIQYISSENDFYKITSDSETICVEGDARFLRKYYCTQKMSFIMDYKLLINISTHNTNGEVVQLFLFRKLHKLLNSNGIGN